MPVQADAVDASLGPVHSFLPPAVNVVAQALLRDPTIRAFKATDLARLLHVSVTDARAGIAAIIGMINRTAMGAPDTALRTETSLGSAVGPFMSLDQAMSRFGSRMGPIVSSATPRPTPSPMWQPDFAPDRQFGAGRVGRSRGHSALPAYGEPGWDDAGAISADLASAATMMIDYLKAHGCGPDATIGDFQDTFNQTYSPPLKLDNKYGPETKAALEHVIADAAIPSALAEATAPPACSYVAPIQPASPGQAQPNAPPGGGGQTQQASMFSSSWTWAALAVGAAAIVISRSKHPPRWARQIGLHR